MCCLFCPEYFLYSQMLKTISWMYILDYLYIYSLHAVLGMLLFFVLYFIISIKFNEFLQKFVLSGISLCFYSILNIVWVWVNSCECIYMNIWPYLAMQSGLRALSSGNHASQFHYAISLYLLISRCQLIICHLM